MWLTERLLLLLSRPASAPDFPLVGDDWAPGQGLLPLERGFPDVARLVSGADVLDFGCGTGRQVAAIAQAGARRVIGVDTNERILEVARSVVAQEGVAERVELLPSLGVEHTDCFDVVFSLNSMEHFPAPEAALAEMRRCLKPGGVLCLKFGPPWYAPYGSHMHFFTRVPWVNLLFSEATIMRVRSRFRSDGAQRFEDVEGGLNRMTVAKFERIVAESGMSVEYRRDRCVRGLEMCGRLPVLRELFVNEISCRLRRASPGSTPPADQGGRRRAPVTPA